MQENNINLNCPCPYDCPRHGKCDECRAYHAKSGSKTYCQSHPSG